MTAVPEKPTLDGLENKWRARWEEDGHLPLRPHQDPRPDLLDRHPAADGERPAAHRQLLSYTHTDIIVRFQRMRGREVFYPMGWDDNGLNVERRVQLMRGIICDPSLPYDPDFRPPDPPADPPIPVSRPNFIEQCLEVDRPARGRLPRAVVDPRPLGRLAPHLPHDRPRGGHAVAARLPSAARAGPRLPRSRRRPSGTSTAGARSPRPSSQDREIQGAYHQLRFRHAADRRPDRHRHHPARAGGRVRRPRRPSQRRALPPADRSGGDHAALRAPGSRSSPTSWPIPRRAPASP